MTSELVRGQNAALPGRRWRLRVEAAEPVVAGALLGDERGAARAPGPFTHPAAPGLPGLEVSRRAAGEHVLAVDVDALPAGVDRVAVVLALPSAACAPRSFAGLAAPRVTVTAAVPPGAGGTGEAPAEDDPLAVYTVTGLEPESAVVALELYRRGDGWRVRAVGQGYAGGLAALLADHGVAEARARELAATLDEAVTGDETVTGDEVTGDTGRPAPVAGDAPGWTMEERLYHQVRGMFEDLARTVAAHRSAVGFADARRERELEQALADPRTRVGPAAGAARAEAEDRYARLVEEAGFALRRDLAQLTAESEAVEPVLPPAYARWDNPVWHGYEAPDEPPMAVRLGDLSLPESGELRIPMLVPLPLERGLWVDSGRTGSVAGTSLFGAGELRRLAAETAAVIAARLAAVHPAGAFALDAIDPSGAAVPSLAPLTEAGLLQEPPAAGAGEVRQLLEGLTRRADLAQMAARGGAADALPPGADASCRLLLVHDFPRGLDDRCLSLLRYLADEGPSVGVGLLLVADREEVRAHSGPVLEPFLRSLLRLTPVPDDHLADPWVGHHWTYEPPLVPCGSQVLPRVLRQVAAARRTFGP